MARLSLGNERVRRLAENKLPALVVREGSVNAVCDLLNERLESSGVTDKIYPNRIHSLLSQDSGRTLNESTVDLIETAVDGILGGGVQTQALPSESASDFVSKVRVHWRASDRSKEALREIAGILATPPAVVRYVLESSGELPKGSAEQLSHPVPSEQPKDRILRDKPDWSFQDTAVQRCVQLLSAGHGRKIGLVLPTAGGKTRTALRVALSMLVQYPAWTGPVLWVTHRQHLRTQAHRELQKMLSQGIQDLPENSAALLANRVEFVMVSELAAKLQGDLIQPLLVIVDEAHHAAAPSYQPIFDAPSPIRGLFLTATPNRTDGLPIGIDEIAFTTTYRELQNRGVIVLPKFEDFPVVDFDWSEASVRDLADEVITRAADDYVKVLVLAPRISRVEEFCAVLRDRLSREASHPLSYDDIGFVHSTGNSLLMNDDSGNVRKASADEFLAHFADKPRAIIVSAQMLLEGFNDPEINTVVITYPSSSMIVLMQAAGRSMRHTPGKREAFLLQARNDSIAYHLEERWLYQEISDYLRPQLTDLEYSDLNDLKSKIGTILLKHRVPVATKNRVMKDVESVALGERCRILLCGLPYYGERETFANEAEWTAVVETGKTSEAFRDLFNTFSAMGANLSDPSDFLMKRGTRYGFSQDFSQDSNWRMYTDMLTAMHFASREIYQDGSMTPQGIGRPFARHGATTWLKYLTFTYAPSVAPEVIAFLEDCHNRESLIAQYQKEPAMYQMIVKLPLPVSGTEGYLFTSAEAIAFQETVNTLRSALTSVEPSKQFAELAFNISKLVAAPISFSVLVRIERFLAETSYAGLVLSLGSISSELPMPAAEQQINSDQIEESTSDA